MSDSEVLAAFTEELEAWRAAHPGWTPREQLSAFSPHRLWGRAGGGVIDLDTGNYVEADRDLYRRLMLAAGYLVPRQPGDDGSLPCGWPGRRHGEDPIDHARRVSAEAAECPGCDHRGLDIRQETNGDLVCHRCGRMVAPTPPEDRDVR